MKTLFFIATLLLSGISQAMTCAERVSEALQTPDALESLAKSINLSPSQIKFLLESPATAEPTQSLLIATLLISEKEEELINELYWRAEGTTKYAHKVPQWNRLYDWMTHFRFWTPLYRDRNRMFSDSLGAIGEKLPEPLLDSFKKACARVEEPGFLRGLAAVSREAHPRIIEAAKSSFPTIRVEINEYLRVKQNPFMKLIMVGSTPKKAAPPRIDQAEKILFREVFDFIHTLDYVPSDPQTFEKEFAKYRARHLADFPKIANVVGSILGQFHTDISPASYEEFRAWVSARFTKVLQLERQRLLKEWNHRPIARSTPPAPTASDTIADDHANSGTLADISSPAKQEKSLSDSDEIDAAEFELFADTTPTQVPVRETLRSPRPFRYKTRRQKAEATSESTPTEASNQSQGFLVILLPKAREDLATLSRNPRREGQLKKVLDLLAMDPKHPSLRTHVGHGATYERGDGTKVFRSAVNMGQSGYRVIWVYGEQEKTIEVREIVHHDEM